LNRSVDGLEEGTCWQSRGVFAVLIELTGKIIIDEFPVVVVEEICSLPGKEKGMHQAFEVVMDIVKKYWKM